MMKKENIFKVIGNKLFQSEWFEVEDPIKLLKELNDEGLIVKFCIECEDAREELKSFVKSSEFSTFWMIHVNFDWEILNQITGINDLIFLFKNISEKDKKEIILKKIKNHERYKIDYIKDITESLI